MIEAFIYSGYSSTCKISEIQYTQVTYMENTCCQALIYCRTYPFCFDMRAFISKRIWVNLDYENINNYYNCKINNSGGVEQRTWANVSFH